MATFWAFLGTVLKAGAQAWLALWEARQRGRAEETARQNAEAAEAERRAAEVRDKSRDDTIDDLDKGRF